MVKLIDVVNLLKLPNTARLATTSKNFKKQYNNRLKAVRDRGQLVAYQAAQAGKRRKKAAIQRIFNSVVLEHGINPRNYNLIKVYKKLNGHNVNVVKLMEIRQNQQSLIKKLEKQQMRLNNAYNKYIHGSRSRPV